MKGKKLSESWKRKLRAMVRKSAKNKSLAWCEAWVAFMGMGPLCSERDRVIASEWRAVLRRRLNARAKT
jgi:hypothetical protein